LVRIGNSEYNNLDIPWSMLEKCFSALKSHRGYNGKYFRENYPKQAKTHGCHVHAIEMIFKRAGIADELKRKYYLKVNILCSNQICEGKIGCSGTYSKYKHQS